MWCFTRFSAGSSSLPDKLFINNIPNFSEKLNFSLFADGTNRLYAERHPKSLQETINKELKNICEWLHVNKPTLKSNFVIF